MLENQAALLEAKTSGLADRCAGELLDQLLGRRAGRGPGAAALHREAELTASRFP